MSRELKVHEIYDVGFKGIFLGSSGKSDKFRIYGNEDSLGDMYLPKDKYTINGEKPREKPDIKPGDVWLSPSGTAFLVSDKLQMVSSICKDHDADMFFRMYPTAQRIHRRSY